MESRTQRNKTLSKGFSYKTSRSRINWNAKDIEKNPPKTSNGWTLFGFLWVLWICIFLIAYFVHNKLLDHEQVLKNAFVIPSGIDFGMVIFWFSGRSLIFSHTTYGFYKITEIIKLRKVKRFLKIEQDDAYFDHMDSYDEYEKYIELKKKNSKTAFYVSCGVFSVLFIITLIVALV